MSASNFDLLKYAATGIASPDMTYYDRMRASTLMGGAVQTLTGIPPLSFKSDGTPLISLSMLGNGQQTGTPSPQSIIMPTLCGVRTANLFDINGKNTANGYANNTQLYADGSTAYWSNGEISEYIAVDADTQYTLTNMGSYNLPAYCFYDTDKQYISGSGFNGRSKITFTTPSNCKYVRITHVKTQPKTMLNLGSTALPYEPFGYKIPLTCAGQTVPVYLSEVPTVRRVKKLVLTGDEANWAGTEASPTGRRRFYLPLENALASDTTTPRSFCSHLPLGAAGATYITDNLYTIANSNFYIRLTADYNTSYDLRSYLTQQYSAGTPVTVWYVLAEPETGIVNEPLAKIGDYADELHSADAGVIIPTAKGQNTLTVETELQPSEMTITFKG